MIRTVYIVAVWLIGARAFSVAAQKAVFRDQKKGLFAFFLLQLKRLIFVTKNFHATNCRVPYPLKKFVGFAIYTCLSKSIRKS